MNISLKAGPTGNFLFLSFFFLFPNGPLTDPALHFAKYRNLSLIDSAFRQKTLKLSIWKRLQNYDISEATQGKIAFTNWLSVGLLALCNHRREKHVITLKYVERSDCKMLPLKKQWEATLNLLTLQERNSRLRLENKENLVVVASY